MSFAAAMASMPAVAGAQVEAVDAGGVPAEWTLPEADSEVRGTLLYLHGGGYCAGSPITHRRLVTSLCVAAGVRGLSVDYRLAPEYPFPAAVEDAVSAYRWLVGAAGESPSRLVVAGDSAGGGLTLALLVALRDDGEALPAGGFLISPGTDLARTGDSFRTRADVDPMVDLEGPKRWTSWYVPDGDVKNPLVSPLYADLGGLPPLLVHVGDYEVLLDDATRVAQRADDQGVQVELKVWPEAFHVFHVFARMIPEADQAISEAASWIAERVAKNPS